MISTMLRFKSSSQKSAIHNPQSALLDSRNLILTIIVNSRGCYKPENNLELIEQ